MDSNKQEQASYTNYFSYLERIKWYVQQKAYWIVSYSRWLLAKVVATRNASKMEWREKWRKKKFKCDECLNSYKIISALLRHQRSCHGEKKYQRTIHGCNRVFSELKTLNVHCSNPYPTLHDPSVIRKPRLRTWERNLEEERKRQITESEQKKRLKCDECCFLNNVETLFSSRYALLRHQRTCHEEFKYHCTIPWCKRVFNDTITRNIHSKNPNPWLHDPSVNQNPRLKTRERNLKNKMDMQTSYTGKLSGSECQVSLSNLMCLTAFLLWNVYIVYTHFTWRQ